jgi:hypothetical protein
MSLKREIKMIVKETVIIKFTHDGKEHELVYREVQEKELIPNPLNKEETIEVDTPPSSMLFVRPVE